MTSFSIPQPPQFPQLPYPPANLPWPLLNLPRSNWEPPPWNDPNPPYRWMDQNSQYTFAPHVPLYQTPTIDLDEFQPSRDIETRYTLEALEEGAQYYGTITITNTMEPEERVNYPDPKGSGLGIPTLRTL